MQRLRGLVVVAVVAALLAALTVSNQRMNVTPRFTSNGLGALEPSPAQSHLPSGYSFEQNPVPAEPGDVDERIRHELGVLAKDRINILLLGIDARKTEPSRSDSIILVSINPNDYSAVLFSIMRDTYITIPTPKPTKSRINTAYALGGPDLTVKSVSNFLQVPIHYYLAADFRGFEKAVDAVGGVEVNVEKKMDYVDDGKFDIHLKPGKQTLNGNQALGYARFRHDVQGDYARVERQRKIIKALLGKVQGIQAVYYLPKLVEAVRPYVQTDLDLSSMATLAYFCYKINDIKSWTIPSTNAHKAQTVAGMSVLIPDLEKTRQEVKAFLQGSENIGQSP